MPSHLSSLPPPEPGVAGTHALYLLSLLREKGVYLLSGPMPLSSRKLHPAIFSLWLISLPRQEMLPPRSPLTFTFLRA